MEKLEIPFKQPTDIWEEGKGTHKICKFPYSQVMEDKKDSQKGDRGACFDAVTVTCAERNCINSHKQVHT